MMGSHVLVRHTIVWIALFGLVAVVGCSPSNQNTSTPPDKMEKPVESTAALTGQEPMEQECQAWAAKMEQAVNQVDVATINELIDWDAILESATGGFPGIESQRQNFKYEFRQSLNGRNGFWSSIARQITGGGTYYFLRVGKIEGKKCARFRLSGPQGGANYHDFVLVREPDGRTKAVDWFIYLSGEMLSKTLRRNFLPVVAHEQRSVLEKLTGAEGDFVKHLVEWRAYSEAAQNGQWQQVHDIYNNFPKSMKRDKNILLVRSQAALARNDKRDYALAIADMERLFPNDPMLALISIDSCCIRGEYDKAIAAIDKFDKAIGGDPFLLVLKAKIFQLKGDTDTAERLVQQAKEIDPTVVNEN